MGLLENMYRGGLSDWMFICRYGIYFISLSHNEMNGIKTYQSETKAMNTIEIEKKIQLHSLTNAFQTEHTLSR